MGDIGGYRYEGYPLAAKHAWLQSGGGPAAAHEGAFALRKCSEVVADTDSVIRAAVGKLGLAWRGGAASRAGDAMACYAADATSAAQTSGAGAVYTGEYGDSFATVRNSVPPPTPEGGNSPFGRLLDTGVRANNWANAHVPPAVLPSIPPAVLAGVQSDYQRRVEANAAADHAANAALLAHENATRAALRAVPAVEAAAGPAGAPSAGSEPGGALGGRELTGRASGGRVVGTTHGGGGPGTAADLRDQPNPNVPSAPTGAVGIEAAGAPDSPLPGPPTAAGVPDGARPTLGAPLPVGAGTTADPRLGGHSLPGPGGRSVPLGGAGPADSSGLGGRGPSGSGPAEPPPGRGGSVGAGGTPLGNAAGQGGRGPAGTPTGIGGGALGGQQRTHRDQHYIPDDEPFRVELSDVAPAVIGVPDDEQPR